MTDRLDWDSECFGYEVGRLIIDNPENFNSEELPVLTKGYSLVYIFSKEEITARFNNLIAVDRKVLLKRETSHLADDFINIRSYRGSMTEQLLKLSLQSGEFSRFKTDTSFRNNEFLKLYSVWIRNSVDRTIADDMFVFGEEDEIQGFISLANKGPVADIGLVAVDSAYRGQGIGTSLVRYAIDQAYSSGCPEIKVVTQFENKAAMSLYEKNGFTISDLTYIYHYRNV
jgi:dTDP-4-amino-4,6-dideoxy-D-galactose acyltransferase